MAENNPIELFYLWQKQVGSNSGGHSATVSQRLVWWLLRLTNNSELVPNNAACLSTVEKATGAPSSRMVLVKTVNQEGFFFYTNYRSRKAEELETNNRASLLFFWPGQMRQVRVEGTVCRVSQEQSNSYWSSRPRGSQIGALASHQSCVLADRDELVQRVTSTKQQLLGQDIPRPEFWGGYCLSPTVMEFWEGKANRLHHRQVFTKNGDATWSSHQLNP